jgi:hypothetical protein
MIMGLMVQVLGYCLQCSPLLLFTSEFLLLQEISLLSNSYNILCKPIYTLHKRISYVLLILIHILVLNQVNPIFPSLSQCTIGLFVMYKFSWSQLYSRIQCSVMESIKAVMSFISYSSQQIQSIPQILLHPLCSS